MESSLWRRASYLVFSCHISASKCRSSCLHSARYFQIATGSDRLPGRVSVPWACPEYLERTCREKKGDWRGSDCTLFLQEPPAHHTPSGGSTHDRKYDPRRPTTRPLRRGPGVASGPVDGCPASVHWVWVVSGECPVQRSSGPAAQKLPLPGLFLLEQAGQPSTRSSWRKKKPPARALRVRNSSSFLLSSGVFWSTSSSIWAFSGREASRNRAELTCKVSAICFCYLRMLERAKDSNFWPPFLSSHPARPRPHPLSLVFEESERHLWPASQFLAFLISFPCSPLSICQSPSSSSPAALLRATAHFYGPVPNCRAPDARPLVPLHWTSLACNLQLDRWC